MSMSRMGRMPFLILLAGALLLPLGLHAQDQDNQASPADQKQESTSKNKKKKADKSDDKAPNKVETLRKLQKELATPYKKWLQEEVPYIISDEERSAFLHLQTNEEREQFIESFWQRRNPDPDSVENDFKEEHYRRIAYANERFSSGVPGWRTDRGRTYIIWGPPDEIEAHPTGGQYNRPESEGGGSTSTYPFEDWRYRHMDGIGDNIIIEFVDTTGTNEYHMTMDPGEKDALAKVPGAGLSELEAMGLSDKTQRFNRTDGSTAPRSLLNNGQDSTNGLSSDNEFTRLEQFAKVQAPPPVKFKDLEEIVSSRILRNQLAFSYRYDYMRITGDTILVPVTVQIQNRQMTFHDREGVHSATLDIFGRISTLTGRIIQTFEDTIQRDFPDSLLEASLKGDSIYQKSVPLRPGLYKIDLVIKDVNSGNVGVLNERLAVPEIPDDKLDASSLILADQLEPVSSKDVGVGQFVLGSTKVRPKLNGEFHTDQPLGIYMQLYNLTVDETSHKNNLSLDVKISQADQTIKHQVVTGDQIKQNGEQVTFQELLAPKSLPPGKYKLDIEATDLTNKQTVSRSADFTVTVPPNNDVAANGTPGR